MYKNIIIYKDTIDFRDKEGAYLLSSRDEYLDLLKAFDGLKIGQTIIEDYKRESQGELVYRDLYFDILIQRRIEAKQYDEKYREEEINVETGYRIYMSKHWKLYDKGELIYDNEQLSRYDDPSSFAKKLTEATLLKTDINAKWTKATFTFDNDLIIETSYISGNINHFLTIVKDPEPMTKVLDFADPSVILYRNESRNSKVTPLDHSK